MFEDGLLSRVYRQPVEVLPHPRTGAPLVVPVRDEPAAAPAIAAGGNHSALRNDHSDLTSP